MIEKKIILKRKNMVYIFFIIFLLISVTYPKTNVLSVPTYLKKGDLLFCDFDYDFLKLLKKYNITHYNPYIRPGYSNDHVAMYIGDNMFIESSPYYWDGNEKEWIGIVTTHIGMFHMWGENFTYGIVKNVSNNQRNNAVDWALNQIGNDYYFLECGELISESYKKQNITLTDKKYYIGPKALIDSNKTIIVKNQDNGLWYPSFYFKWYSICIFDYIDNISDSKLFKDIFNFYKMIST